MLIQGSCHTAAGEVAASHVRRVRGLGCSLLCFIGFSQFPASLIVGHEPLGPWSLSTNQSDGRTYVGSVLLSERSDANRLVSHNSFGVLQIFVNPVRKPLLELDGMTARPAQVNLRRMLVYSTGGTLTERPTSLLLQSVCAPKTVASPDRSGSHQGLQSRQPASNLSHWHGAAKEAQRWTPTSLLLS